MKPARTITMNREKIERYGRLNGDNGIVHYGHGYAARRGFRGTLNHGMMTPGNLNFALN